MTTTEAPADPDADRLFRALLDLYMVSDPWPLDAAAHMAVTEALNRGARVRGYDGWVAAYHEMPKQTPKQVCELHGDPDDIVYCPHRLCQMGRIPQWTGHGMPAGTRRCDACQGIGWMPRRQADQIRLPYDYDMRQRRGACMCRTLGLDRG